MWQSGKRTRSQTWPWWLCHLRQIASQRSKWQPTLGPLPGKSHEQRSLVGYSPWGCKRVGHDWVTKQPNRVSNTHRLHGVVGQLKWDHEKWVGIVCLYSIVSHYHLQGSPVAVYVHAHLLGCPDSQDKAKMSLSGDVRGPGGWYRFLRSQGLELGFGEGVAIGCVTWGPDFLLCAHLQGYPSTLAPTEANRLVLPSYKPPTRRLAPPPTLILLVLHFFLPHSTDCYLTFHTFCSLFIVPLPPEESKLCNGKYIHLWFTLYLQNQEHWLFTGAWSISERTEKYVSHPQCKHRHRHTNGLYPDQISGSHLFPAGIILEGFTKCRTTL